MSSRSSVSSEKSRLDPLTYQSYTAGLLHSSGKSEKFLKLQKHFEVLERITEIEGKTQISGKSKGWMDNLALKNELFAKYDVQSIEELQWLYQELSDAQKNAEFFYDLQRLAVYQWKPANDFGLKKKGKSLSDLKDFYENIEKEESTSLSNTFFDKAKQSEKKLAGRKEESQKKGKYTQRALYGTNIPEKLDRFEIYVEEKKGKKITDSDGGNDNLHIRSMSAPYMKHLKDNDRMHKRSDSSKGSKFGRTSSPDRHSHLPKKPQVGEVMPVQRQVSQRSPILSDIAPGPHDFASRMTETSSVARPLQNNLEIYNSLENPQYKASVGMDGRPIHMSRKSSLTKAHELTVLPLNLKLITATVKENSNDITAHTEPTCDLKENAKTEKTGEASEGVSANFLKNMLDNSSVKVEVLSTNNFNSSRKDRRIDYSPNNSVKSAIANLEEVNEPTVHVENWNVLNKLNVTKSWTYPDLLPNQSNNFPITTDGTMDKFKVNNAGDQNIFTEEPPHTSVENITQAKGPSFRVGNKMTASFRVRDLRSLAVNNEFSESKFFPSQSVPKAVSPAVPAKTDLIRKNLELKLHSPVVSQIWTGNASKLPSTVDVDDAYDARRGSVSSTDTFIVKESDDELETIDRQPVNCLAQTQGYLTQPKNKFSDFSFITQTTKSNSVPDFNEKAEPIRPRSAKSYGNLDRDDDNLLNGRHCIPRFTSGDLLDMQPKDDAKMSFISKYSSEPVKHISDIPAPGTHRDSSNDYHTREMSYDAYIPPVEILKDVARNLETYKRTQPIDKPKKPSLVGKMTLDYLQELGSEWESSKGKNRSKEEKRVSDSKTVLLDPKPFIGSDIAASPNRWFPVKETKGTVGEMKTERPANTILKEQTHSVNGIAKTEARYMPKTDFQENSVYKKYLTLPRNKQKQRPEGYKASDPYSYNTLPRTKHGTSKGVPNSHSADGKRKNSSTVFY